jgi:glycosyltransferase involved in cell wall biosynthesis
MSPMQRASLSVVVVARDEEERIGACLDSVAFADERLVVDTGSSDQTRELAKARGARVIELAWRGFGPTKAEALGLAAGDWVLLLDADERVDRALAGEIGKVLEGGNGPEGPPGFAGYAGYEVCRRARFLGRWLEHGNWGPDWVLRLVRRGAFVMSPRPVHESLSVAGRRGRLAGELLHETDPDLHRYLTKLDLYTSLAADDLADRGVRFRLRDLLIRPPAIFVKAYVLRAGFRDGLPGFLIAVLSATHVFVKYAKLWEIEASGKQRTQPE